MPKLGQRHGRIVAITPHYGQRGRLKCVVRCDCGVEKEIWAGNFYKMESCGCYKKEVAGTQATTHGFTRGSSQGGRRPAEYEIWGNMIQRCTNPKRPEYVYYGGRGIKVCERWRSFENFYADMGPRPSPAHSIDRYPNNDGDYEPGNVRWATFTEQGRNKRNNVFVDVGDEKLVQSAAAEKAGINATTFHGRIQRGWSGTRAVNETPKSRPQLNLTSGQRFGRLVVFAAVGQLDAGKHDYYRVRCDCGKEKNVRGTRLARGELLDAFGGARMRRTTR